MGFVLGLLKLHRAWQVVQPATGLGRGLKIPTPGSAVGFLFIPFFNLYWMFVAFKGLMDAANALREDRHIPGPIFRAGTAVFFACCACVLPFAFLLAFIIISSAYGSSDFIIGLFIADIFCFGLSVSCLLFMRIASDAARIVNTIR